MEQNKFKNELNLLIENSIKKYEKAPNAFVDAWPLFGQNNLFGLLSKAKKTNDIDLLNKHMYVLEELCKINISGLLLSFLTQGWIIHILERLSSNEYQKNLVDSLIKGEKIGSFCLTEQQYGSSYSKLKTKAIKVDGSWNISGEKIYITNAKHADFFIVVANTSTEKNDSISFFIIPKEKEGLIIEEESVNLCGNHHSGISKIIIDCKGLDEKHLIGKLGNGYFILPECLQFERIDIAMASISVAKESLKRSLEYLNNRKINPDQSLVDYQVIQHKLVNVYTRIELVDFYVRKTSVNYIKEKKINTNEIMISKIFSTETVRDILWELIQLHGAYGYLRDGYLNTMFNNIAPLVMGGGANDALRNGIFKNINIKK